MQPIRPFIDLVLSLGLMLLSVVVHGQAKAQSCFFSIDFENGEIPADWDLGPEVERQSNDGMGLGEFVAAWSVGNAADANAAGFFPVPDIGIGNQFAMANDDAAPCNCDLEDITLTTPSIDLSGRVGVALECRVFNDEALGGGPASVQVSSNGGPWNTRAVVPVNTSDWQDLFVDLSDLDDQADVRVRFTWTDSGNWAGGFAIDDLCIRERHTNDLSVMKVQANDPSISPFVVDDRSLKYRLLPLEQVTSFTVAVEIKNSGTADLQDPMVSVLFQLNGSDHGPFSSEPTATLAPGERAWILVHTEWQPENVGELEVIASADATGPDDDESDNTGTYSMHMTGPGWDDHYGAMASDEGMLQGTIGGQQNFIAANRVEMIDAGSIPKGISAVLGPNSEEGEQVRAILLDQNLAFVDTSTRLTLSASDIQTIGSGEALYFPFNDPIALAEGDYFVGLQHLDGPGQVFAGVSGNGPAGAAVLMEGVNFDITYIRSTPMVRLHLEDVGVGVQEYSFLDVPALQIFPVPLVGQGRIQFTTVQGSALSYTVLDVAGRVVQERLLGYHAAGEQRMIIDVTGLASGTYVVRVAGTTWVGTSKIVVQKH